MSTLPPDRVFTGFWIDHLKGVVLGSTITVGSNTANVLVALLSILVTFAGSHLWDVIAFCHFAYHTTRKPRDSLHYQQRLILRNITSPTAIVYKTWDMCWQHRTDRLSAIRRTVLLTTIAGLCSSSFLVAGIFSSQIVDTTGIKVLADSAFCGFQNRNWPGATNISSNVPSDDFANLMARDSVEYVQTCYNGSISDPSCQIFATQTIPFDTSYTTCPFDRLCMLQGNQALRMDTGIMWSDETFGINSRSASALGMRKVTMCAPLNVTRYQHYGPMDEIHSIEKSGRGPKPGEFMYNYDLGPWPGDASNDTFTLSSFDLEASSTYTAAVIPWYNMSTPHFGTSAWFTGLSYDPIEQLLATESDVSLIVIGGGVLHGAPVDDPVFSAHIPANYTFYTSFGLQNVTLYGGDDPVRMVGCTEQYQICVKSRECTSLSSAMSTFNQASNLKLSRQQNVTLYLLADSVINFSVGMYSLDNANLFPLLASTSRVSNGNILPPNQWELEVKYWKAIILSIIQKTMTCFASGAGASAGRFASDYDNVVKWPAGDTESWLCHSQKMIAPNGFSNISVFGLSFTLSACGFIVVVNCSLIKSLHWLSKRRKNPWVFIEQWDENEILQFQRTVYESNGIGSWQGQPGATPVTARPGSLHGLASAVKPNPMRLWVLPVGTHCTATAATTAAGRPQQIPSPMSSASISAPTSTTVPPLIPPPLSTLPQTSTPASTLLTAPQQTSTQQATT